MIDLKKGFLWLFNVIKENTILLLEGALIGTGAILPGVSGGVLCAAFGIYEPLMEFISHPVSSFKKNIKIILPVLIGGAAGFVLLARAVEALLGFSTYIAMMLFCGLICGTLPELTKNAKKEGSKKGWIGFAVALIGLFLLFSYLKGGVAQSITPNFGWYIFCGVAWGLSMVVPGLSSSSILLFLGLYEPMSQGIGNIDFNVLIPLGIGFAATLIITARPVNYIIKNFYGIFSKVILGFVVASVIMIFPIPEKFGWELIVGFICFVVGYIVAFYMGKAEEKK